MAFTSIFKITEIIKLLVGTQELEHQLPHECGSGTQMTLCHTLAKSLGEPGADTASKVSTGHGGSVQDWAGLGWASLLHYELEVESEVWPLSVYEADELPFTTKDVPRPYRWPQYLASSILSSKNI